MSTRESLLYYCMADSFSGLCWGWTARVKARCLAVAVCAGTGVSSGHAGLQGQCSPRSCESSVNPGKSEPTISIDSVAVHTHYAPASPRLPEDRRSRTDEGTEGKGRRLRGPASARGARGNPASRRCEGSAFPKLHLRVSRASKEY